MGLYVATTDTGLCLSLNEYRHAGVCTSRSLLLYSVSYYMSTGMQGSARRYDCYCTCVSNYSSTSVQGYVRRYDCYCTCVSPYMSTGVQGSVRRYDCYCTHVSHLII